MKKLEDFRLISSFLASEGITPTMAMVALPASEWSDLVLLAEEWQREQEREEAEREQQTAPMDEADSEMAQKADDERRRREHDALLYHSSGFRPGRHR